MAISPQVLVASVLATSDLCSQPMANPGDGPALCHLYGAQRVETPYFSIDLEHDYLIGIDRGGRRMHIQSTLSRGIDSLTIEVVSTTEPTAWSDCADVKTSRDAEVSWRDCRRNSEAVVERQLIGTVDGGYVVVQYFYTAGIGTERAPSLERMTQSIRVHAI
jgi:hypothetical protein